MFCSSTVWAATLSVAVTPATASVPIGKTQQFTATVSNASKTTVTWYVNDVKSGNSTVGTITSAGLYTAPATVPSTAKVTVKAVSTLDTTKSASATVTVTKALTISLSPTAATVPIGKTQLFTSTIASATNTTVTWYVNNVKNGNSTVGTITSAGLYTAPATVPSAAKVTVKTVSTLDTTKSASATVTITKALAIAISPTSATVVTSKTQQFTATITSATNTSAVWYVNSVKGGNSTVGTVTTAGLYTAPAAVPSTPTVTVKAVSALDTTKYASAAVTIQAASASKLAITAASPTTVSPFAQFTVTGTGFNLSGAISLVFISQSGGTPITIPVSRATTTSAIVAAPIYVNATTGLFAAGTFNVQAVQVVGTTIYTSNLIKGIKISAPPSVPTGATTGAVTAIVLGNALNVSSTLQSAASSKTALATLGADMALYDTDVAPLLAAVKTIKASSTKTVSLSTVNSGAFKLSAKALALSDQLLYAYVTQFSSQMGSLLSSSAESANSIAAATSSSTCLEDNAYLEKFASDACEYQTYAQTQATVGAKAVQTGAKIEIGATLGVLGGWAVGALSAAGAVTETAAQALQIGWNTVTPYIASFATSSTLPTLSDSLKSTAAQLIDNFALGALGVLPASFDSASMYKDAAALTATSKGSAPAAGILVTDTQTKAPTSTSVLASLIVGSSGTVTYTSIGAPQSQTTSTVSGQTIGYSLPIGDYSGKVTVHVGAYTCCVSGYCSTSSAVTDSETFAFTASSSLSINQFINQICPLLKSAGGSTCTTSYCSCQIGSESFRCVDSCSVTQSYCTPAVTTISVSCANTD